MGTLQIEAMWSCVSTDDGGPCAPTHGTTEMLLSSAERSDTHHLVKPYYRCNSDPMTIIWDVKVLI